MVECIPEAVAQSIQMTTCTMDKFLYWQEQHCPRFQWIQRVRAKGADGGASAVNQLTLCHATPCSSVCSAVLPCVMLLRRVVLCSKSCRQAELVDRPPPAPPCSKAEDATYARAAHLLRSGFAAMPSQTRLQLQGKNGSSLQRTKGSQHRDRECAFVGASTLEWTGYKGFTQPTP